MADRYLLESGAPDGYLLEDGSGVLLLEGDGSGPFFGVAGANPVLRKQRGVVHVGATLLLTTLALSGFPRGPLKAPVPKPSAQQPSASLGSNMALLASGAPEAAPFVQQAQSNPVLAKRGFVYDSAGNNLLVTTLARPSPQSAQPNPLAAPRGQAALGAQLLCALLRRLARGRRAGVREGVSVGLRAVAGVAAQMLHALRGRHADHRAAHPGAVGDVQRHRKDLTRGMGGENPDRILAGAVLCAHVVARMHS